jgi:hypothetical protein
MHRPIFDRGLTGFYLVEDARVLKKYVLEKRRVPMGHGRQQDVG